MKERERESEKDGVYIFDDGRRGFCSLPRDEKRGYDFYKDLVHSRRKEVD